MTEEPFSWQKFHQGLNDELAFYQDALDAAKRQGDSLQQVSILNQIATVYRRKHEDSIAISIYEHMLSLLRTADNRDLEWEAVSLLNIAQTCFAFSDWRRMQEVCQEVIPILRLLGDKPAEANALLLLAQAHDNQAHNQEAISFLNQALQIQIDAGLSEAEDTRVWLEELQTSISEQTQVIRISKVQFSALLSKALETAAVSAEASLKRHVSRTFEIELHGTGSSKLILTPEQALEHLFIGEEIFYRVIDVSVIAVGASKTRIFLRASSHTPSDWEHTWSPSTGDGPFKQVAAQNIEVLP